VGGGCGLGASGEAQARASQGSAGLGPLCAQQPVRVGQVYYYFNFIINK
jgi:hypothetical protein